MGKSSLSYLRTLAADALFSVCTGHTKCGAVQAAITSPSKEVITNMDETRIDVSVAVLWPSLVKADLCRPSQQWIRPIRSLFATTNRTEIVAFREALRDAETIEAKDVTDDVLRCVCPLPPAETLLTSVAISSRALVEENVKINVQRLAQDSSVQHVRRAFSWSPPFSSSPLALAGLVSLRAAIVCSERCSADSLVSPFDREQRTRSPRTAPAARRCVCYYNSRLPEIACQYVCAGLSRRAEDKKQAELWCALLRPFSTSQPSPPRPRARGRPPRLSSAPY